MTKSHLSRPAPAAVSNGSPVIAVLRSRHACEYAPVIESLLSGGITLIELTMTTEGVLDELTVLREAFGQEAEIGVGTVTDVAQARLVLDAGAEFVVTPTLNVDVIAASVDRGVPVFPGGLTPTELFASWSAGATAVKVFPASAVGPGYVGQLRGPFPQLQLIPSGGVDIEDAPVWITAGAMAVSIGSPLIKDAFDGGSLTELRSRARRATDLVAEASQARGEGRLR